jgi:hypothetical protein
MCFYWVLVANNDKINHVKIEGFEHAEWLLLFKFGYQGNVADEGTSLSAT